MILTLDASRFGISNIARRTSTFDYMIINVTIHVSSTRIFRARILTAVIDASFVGRTIRITLTTEKDARDSRIATESW